MEFNKHNIDNYKIIIRSKYQAVYFPSHPRAYSDGIVYLHILVAENKLGRFLTPNEVVHHKDFNKINNLSDNIMVFNSNKDHITYHSCLKNGNDYALIFKNGTYRCICLSYDENGSEKASNCPICGKLKTNSAKCCIACSKKLHAGGPSRDVLKRQLISRNFSQIAKLFNVSDNAVRKWCKREKLPFKTSELRKLSNEEILSL